MQAAMASWGAPRAGAPRPIELTITKDSGPSQILKSLSIGAEIKCVTVVVATPFDVGFLLSIGFPADHDEIATTAELDLTKINTYKKDVYRTSAIAETLTAYFTGGASVGGSAKIVIEMIR